MPTTLTTSFGKFVSPQENIVVRDIGGRDHFCRRQLILEDESTHHRVASIDIQSDSSPSRISQFLERNGFKREASPA